MSVCVTESVLFIEMKDGSIFMGGIQLFPFITGSVCCVVSSSDLHVQLQCNALTCVSCTSLSHL